MNINSIAEAMREAAAKYHDDSIAELNEQIALNDAYKQRSGSQDNGANKLCRRSIYEHQLDAAQIRSIPIPDYSEWVMVPKDLVRQAYNAGWRQGEIEASPYSQGGVPWCDSDICAMITAKDASND